VGKSVATASAAAAGRPSQVLRLLLLLLPRCLPLQLQALLLLLEGNQGASSPAIIAGVQPLLQVPSPRCHRSPSAAQP